MPQLDFHTFAPQIVWLAISFLLLLLFMSRVALPRVGAIIDERAGRISGDLAEATRLRDETEKALIAYQQALADAKLRAQGIAAQVRGDVSADIARQRAAIDQQLAAKSTDAERRITALKEEAMTHVGEIAGETAQAVVARLLGKSTDSAELQVAVNEALGK
jgi:F-type H+-transporting ATPase subunit b